MGKTINQLKEIEKLTKSKLIDDKEAAKIIGVSHYTMKSYRLRKIGPHYYKMGRAVRYSKKDLNDYLEKQKSNWRRVETNQNY